MGEEDRAGSRSLGIAPGPLSPPILLLLMTRACPSLTPRPSSPRVAASARGSGLHAEVEVYKK